MQNSLIDVSLEGMLQAMCRHDFNEPEFVGTSTMFECSEVPREYRKFIGIVKEEPPKNLNIVVFQNHFLTQI